MTRSAALSGAASRVLRTAAGRRALHVALLLGGLLVIGLLCGQRADAADGGTTGQAAGSLIRQDAQAGAVPGAPLESMRGVQPVSARGVPPVSPRGVPPVPGDGNVLGAGAVGERPRVPGRPSVSPAVHEAPVVPESPVASTSTAAPSRQEAPAERNRPVTSPVSEAPLLSWSPAPVSLPELPVLSAGSALPGTSPLPGLPDRSVLPGAPLPSLPELPGALPHVPDLPVDDIALPEIPGLPEAPNFPEPPGLPAPPNLPEKPSLPEPPGLPESPGLPEAPGDLVLPGDVVLPGDGVPPGDLVLPGQLLPALISETPEAGAAAVPPVAVPSVGVAHSVGWPVVAESRRAGDHCSVRSAHADHRPGHVDGHPGRSHDHPGHPPADQAPAERPDGTVGSRSSADSGTPRHGDAHAVTPSRRAPLRLAPGTAARDEATGTRDGRGDVPLFPG
ncbi:hypothetical protein [Streptomyces sp. NPDC029554]|uniref:hypothetical protein n=1 Tax=Streptomyces sp. NPDC029554 TaxID=3155126 RepID=UPI0033D81F88